MNELQIFENATFGEIRVLEIDGEPWFVGKDIAFALGYNDTDQALRKHVAEEDKLTRQIDGSGQNRNMTIINESGLYSLIMSSKLPAAKEFKRWVTHDILPSIRKHGVYATSDMIDKMIQDPDLGIRLLTELKEERETRKQLETEVAVKTQQLAEAAPKVSYYDIVLQCPDLLPISQIAKDYGMSAQKMNKLLNEAGVQYKQGNIWLLYQKYASEGYTQTRTDVYEDSDGESHAKLRTCWTQKGRLFIYDLLKSKFSILPLIEREDDEDGE